MVIAVGLGVVGAAGLLVVRTAALATDLPLYTLKLMGCPTEMNRTITDAPPEIFRAIHILGVVPAFEDRRFCAQALYLLCSGLAIVSAGNFIPGPSDDQTCYDATIVMGNRIVLNC
jgi:hypothetical protein